ncbi:MAG: FkbM family methyltransferase [Candidatus Omnitrophica bacterium]|nr:FkbM family methyltransferase [Candidatus Omnitrophota bacterium]
MENSLILENLFLSLPLLKDYHQPSSQVHAFLKQIARLQVESISNNRKTIKEIFGPFGRLIFPYHKMGSIDSLNLFDLDELIIFSFYWRNRKRYRNVLDIGANLGLHSIILDKCGYRVRSYEPDPKHFKIIIRNLSLNKCKHVQVFNCAVSNKIGDSEFIRVVGNTTGSHLAGSKAHPYGKLKKFTVSTIDFVSIMGWADLIKLDAEGHEKEILLGTKRGDWLTTDALVEVENEINAALIYRHFKELNVNLFSQKNNWKLVRGVKEMPCGYKEGTLFISRKDSVPGF